MTWHYNYGNIFNIINAIDSLSENRGYNITHIQRAQVASEF